MMHIRIPCIGGNFHIRVQTKKQKKKEETVKFDIKEYLDWVHEAHGKEQFSRENLAGLACEIFNNKDSYQQKLSKAKNQGDTNNLKNHAARISFLKRLLEAREKVGDNDKLITAKIKFELRFLEAPEKIKKLLRPKKTVRFYETVFK